MTKADKAKICLTAVSLLLGVIIGIQAKTVRMSTSVYDLKRVNELSAELTSIQNENENLRTKLESIQSKLTEYENSIAEGNTSLGVLKQNLNEFKTEAGKTRLTGRGVIITLNDSKKASTTGGVDQSAFLVHAEDILSITNELFSAGAEAISINGQRMIATSNIRCAGSIVNVNGVKIAAPFVISAIGNPDILEAAIIFPGGVKDSLAPWGIELDIKKQNSIEVDAYTGNVEFKEAKTAEE